MRSVKRRYRDVQYCVEQCDGIAVVRKSCVVRRFNTVSEANAWARWKSSNERNAGTTFADYKFDSDLAEITADLMDLAKDGFTTIGYVAEFYGWTTKRAGQVLWHMQRCGKIEFRRSLDRPEWNICIPGTKRRQPDLTISQAGVLRALERLRDDGRTTVRARDVLARADVRPGSLWHVLESLERKGTITITDRQRYGFTFMVATSD